MKYCARCLYPENHPLGIIFNEQGICSGCLVHEEKDSLNWQERGKLLEEILAEFRNTSGKSYDCIIPVSGGRDSYFIVHTIKNVYKMHPLLVTYNKQYNTHRGIRNLAYLKTIFGCDLLTLTVSPERVKKITKHTLKKMGSMYWHCLAGQTVFPVQIAVRFKIPLIIWGAHQGNDQVGQFSHLNEVEMTRRYRKDHDLMGYEAEDLLQNSELTKQDITPFLYPHDKDIERVGVRGIYLNNYIRWDSKAQHEKMIELYNYETAPQQRTFDTYNDVDCFNYSDIHDYIKFLKWGYGKVTDHASREIRLKRLAREKGIELVKQYQQVLPNQENLQRFLQWVGMSEREFYECIDMHRNAVAWKQVNGAWQLTDSIANHEKEESVEAARLEKKSFDSTQDKEDCNFIVTPPKDPEAKDEKYILYGRGWVDNYAKNP